MFAQFDTRPGLDIQLLAGTKPVATPRNLGFTVPASPAIRPSNTAGEEPKVGSNCFSYWCLSLNSARLTDITTDKQRRLAESLTTCFFLETSPHLRCGKCLSKIVITQAAIRGLQGSVPSRQGLLQQRPPTARRSNTGHGKWSRGPRRRDVKRFAARA